MRVFITICLVLLGAVSLFAKDTSRFVVTTTPQMSCQNCVKKIEGNLRFEKGVKKVEAVLENQTVTVTYDPEKTDEQKLTKAFEKLNYKVTPVEAKKSDCKESSDKKRNGKKSSDGKSSCCDKK